MAYRFRLHKPTGYIFGFAAFLLPCVVHAQTAPDLNKINVPIVSGNNLVAVLQNLLGTVLLGLGILAFLYVVYGGYLYVTAGGDPAKAEKGRNSIVYAMIGIFIIFLSYSFVRYVNSRVGKSQPSTSRSATPTPSTRTTAAPFIGPTIPPTP